MKFIIFFIVILLYFFGIKYLFRLICHNKKTLSIRFAKSLFLILGFAIISYNFLATFEIAKDVNKTLLQSGTLMIAIVTFSCQKVLGNIISGVVISIAKPFDIGDKVTLKYNSESVVTGVVKDINIRHTVIKMADGKHVILANSLVDNYVCINENISENNGYPLVMECTFDSDVRKAMDLMQEEIDKHPLTTGQDYLQSTVTCSGVSANGFQLKAIIFTSSIADNITACSDLRISIFKVWKNNGIELPFNTLTVINQ